MGFGSIASFRKFAKEAGTKLHEVKHHIEQAKQTVEQVHRVGGEVLNHPITRVVAERGGLQNIHASVHSAHKSFGDFGANALEKAPIRRPEENKPTFV
jgi:hypothetical protein